MPAGGHAVEFSQIKVQHDIVAMNDVNASLNDFYGNEVLCPRHDRFFGTRTGECQAGQSSGNNGLSSALSHTAGSGRVPAAFNNLVGYKPTMGALSMRGVVPACRTLDVMSIFALTAEDAVQVARVAGKFDASDAWSRSASSAA